MATLILNYFQDREIKQFDMSQILVREIAGMIFFIKEMLDFQILGSSILNSETKTQKVLIKIFNFL